MAKDTDGSTESRFWAKVDKSGPAPSVRSDLGRCWLWTGYVMPSGYGFWQYGGRSAPVKTTAHRYSYELVNGEIPPGLHVDHLCLVRRCVRPGHLDAVTQAENNRRAGAARVRKTHCLRGHELVGDNVYVSPLGRRSCRACSAARVRAFKERERAGRPTRLRTHCRAGHDLSADNLYVKPNGKRECRTCRREQFRARSERQPPSPPRELKTHCPSGHEYAGENLYIDPRGRRFCRKCQRAHARAWKQRTGY